MEKTLGQKIKELRLSKRMTQGDLGRGLVTPSMISQIEADKASPSHKLLAQLAQRLGVTLDYFLGDIQAKMEKNSIFKYARMLMGAENYKGAAKLLEELLAEPIPHLEVAEVQLNLAECLHKQGKSQEALDLYEEILRNSLGQGEPFYAVKALRAMGLAEYEKDNLVLAHFHWTKAADVGLREVRNDADLLADVLLLLAKAKSKLGDHTGALESLQKANNLLDTSDDLRKLAVLAETFSKVHKELGHHQKAAEHAEEAAAIYKKLNMPVQAIRMKISLAQIREETGKPDDAVRMLEECLKQLEQSDVNAVDDIAYIHSVMAGIFFRLEHFDLAKSHCEKALASAKNDYETLAEAHRILTNVYLKQRQYPEAVAHCEQLIELCQKNRYIADLTRSFTLLTEIYKRQGNYMSAAETFLRMQKEIENNLREKTVAI